MGTGGGGIVSGRFLPIFRLGRAFLAGDLLEVVDVELGESWLFRKSSTIVSLIFFAGVDSAAGIDSLITSF